MAQLFDSTTNALKTAISMRLLKGNVINANIANAETPGYSAKKMDFEAALARALDLDGVRDLSTSHPDHFALGSGGQVKADIYDNPEGEITNDGNTVNLEKEMAALAENQIQYRAALQLINRKIAALRYSIGEGR